LVTMDLSRSRQSVTSGNPSALRLGKPLRLATRVGSCPTDCGGRRCGRCPCPTPLPIGFAASISIKGSASPTSSPVRYSLRSVPRAASGRALDTASSHNTATTGNERGNETAKTRRPLVTAARWPGREAVANIRLWQAGFSWASVRPAA